MDRITTQRELKAYDHATPQASIVDLESSRKDELSSRAVEPVDLRVEYVSVRIRPTYAIWNRLKHGSQGTA